jgi:hypothetical protein
MNGIALAIILASACVVMSCSNAPSRATTGSGTIATGSTVTYQTLVPTPKTMSDPTLVVLADIPGISLLRAVKNDLRRAKIGDALTKDGFNVASEFQEALAAQLKKAGAADVSTLSVAREHSNYGYEPKESELPAGPATACFFDTFLIYGFRAHVAGADYEPYMAAHLKIFRGGNHATTYIAKFSYNFLNRNIEVEPSTPLASWTDGAAVEADIRGARDAFRNAIADLSRTVAAHLQANGRLGKC